MDKGTYVNLAEDGQLSENHLCQAVFDLVEVRSLRIRRRGSLVGWGRGVTSLYCRLRSTRCCIPGLAPFVVVEIRLRTLYEARYMLDSMQQRDGAPYASTLSVSRRTFRSPAARLLLAAFSLLNMAAVLLTNRYSARNRYACNFSEEA